MNQEIVAITPPNKKETREVVQSPLYKEYMDYIGPVISLKGLQSYTRL